jgi:hypothetical protein
LRPVACAVEEHGILGAVERAVKKESAGYRRLVQNGLEEKAFDAVILRHPNSFSEEAVKIARERLERLKQKP